MSLTDRTRPVLMQLTRLVNQWKAYDRRGHVLLGDAFTAGELQTLKVAAEFPAHNMTDLAEELGVTKGAVSQAVSKLVERGFLERYQGTSNDRERFVRLTRAGSKAYQAHMKTLEVQLEAFDALLAEADPAHAEFMLDFLARAEAVLRQEVAGSS